MSQDDMYEGDAEPRIAAAAGPLVDWRARIRACLSGTVPIHDPDQWLVPGHTLQESRRFMVHFPVAPKAAAVLVPLIERERALTVLLTERAPDLKNHAGQISFPGGRVEPQDLSPMHAALREAHEEVGLDPAFVDVVGYLPDHVIISGFRVTPVVAFVRPGFQLLLDSNEVQSTFEVPLDYLFDRANHRMRRRRIGPAAEEIDVLDIPFGAHNIWGATAGMLLTLSRICLREAHRE